MNREICKILKQWKEEAGVKYPTLFKYRNGQLQIYTSSPGWYIGLHGCLVDKYRNILQEVIPSFKELLFVEVEPWTV